MNRIKKIGILTQPLQDNYGGLLQAYALKEVLQLMGHEVLIINRRFKPSTLKSKLNVITKRILKNTPIPLNFFLDESKRNYISKNTNAFREKYIPNLSQLITSDKEMEGINKLGFNVLIAGSDQCWRPRYSPSIRNYFFDFAENQKGVKRISYAASFGVSNWEFNAEDTRVCNRLLQKFDAISVREDSGKELVKDYLGREDAVHVIDPTMLLNKDDYKTITTQENILKSDGNLFRYILDETPEKLALVKKVERVLGLRSFEVYPKRRLNQEKVNESNIEDFVVPNPAQWLRAYEDAKFVIADSFHGIAFSILFNIPFIALGNKRRGLARFSSLLKMFDLKERLITDVKDIQLEQFLNKDIDWNKVNEKLEYERNKAKTFLNNNLQ